MYLQKIKARLYWSLKCQGLYFRGWNNFYLCTSILFFSFLVPNAPTITSVMNQSTFEVLVEWTISVPDGLPGAITHFTVYVDNNAVENTADGTVLSYTISNLAPFQLVMVEVSASTSAGEGSRSAAMSGRSSEACKWHRMTQ